MRKSSLTDPLTDAEIDEANAVASDLWIHIRCKRCGDVECCFNKSQVAVERLCFPCLMGVGKGGSMKVRVTSVFVSKFNEAMRKLDEDSPEHMEEIVCSECDSPWVAGAKKCEACKDPDAVPRTLFPMPRIPRHLAVEEFLTTLAPDLARTLKHQLLECLLAEAAGRAAAVPTESSVLDTTLDPC